MRTNTYRDVLLVKVRTVESISQTMRTGGPKENTYLLKYDSAAYVRRQESSLKRKRRSSSGLFHVSLCCKSVGGVHDKGSREIADIPNVAGPRASFQLVTESAHLSGEDGQRSWSSEENQDEQQHCAGQVKYGLRGLRHAMPIVQLPCSG